MDSFDCASLTDKYDAMSNNKSDSLSEVMPVFLLKDKYEDDDPYVKHFAESKGIPKLEPIFVPVLEHQFIETEVEKFRDILYENQIGKQENSRYGGLIFTSRRAVEAFMQLVVEGVEEGTDVHDWKCLREVPIYSVGPATTRALKAIPLDHPLNIFESECGNAKDLGHFILSHYREWYSNWDHKRPLLFVGSKHKRGDIPMILMDFTRGSDKIPVEELDIYTTSVKESFLNDLIDGLRGTVDRGMRWIVFFSPAATEKVLDVLGIIDSDTKKAGPRTITSPGQTQFATIGPSTTEYLLKTFNMKPEFSAQNPTPEEIEKGIREFLAYRRKFLLDAISHEW